MHRSFGGALAAIVVLAVAAGCSSTGADDSRAVATPRPVEEPANELVAATAAPLPAEPTLEILVTSPEGVDAPGLDAAASVLLTRPDIATTIVAPAVDMTGAGDDRSSGALAPVESTTMTGLVAHAVNGTSVDAFETAVTQRGLHPDLVVVGFTAGSPAGDEGSAAAYAIADAAVARGIPALVVEVTGTEPDLAAAGLMLSTVLDFDLDAILAEPSVHALTVGDDPATEAGAAPLVERR